MLQRHRVPYDHRWHLRLSASQARCGYRRRRRSGRGDLRGQRRYLRNRWTVLLSALQRRQVPEPRSVPASGRGLHLDCGLLPRLLLQHAGRSWERDVRAERLHRRRASLPNSHRLLHRPELRARRRRVRVPGSAELRGASSPQEPCGFKAEADRFASDQAGGTKDGSRHQYRRRSAWPHQSPPGAAAYWSNSQTEAK